MLCKKCKTRPIIIERSKSYCFHCLESRNKANRKYNLTHKKENYERTRKWISDNREKSRKYYREYRANLTPAQKILHADGRREWKRSDSGKESAKKYRAKNKEKLSIYWKEYYIKNIEKIKSYKIGWLAQHPGLGSSYTRKYNASHPEMVTKSSRKRRKLFEGIEGNFNLQEWKDLCSKFGNSCLWCGSNKEKLTVDHVVPISRGGNNYIENIQPLCARCNAKKNAKTLDFRPFGAAILEWT